MRHRLLGLIVMLVLAACASAPSRFTGTVPDYGPARERQIFHALTYVKADDSQRAAILASFDATDPALKGLAEQLASAQEQLQALDARSPDYLAQTDALARQRNELELQKIDLQAQFSQVVASRLTTAQWRSWKDIFRPREATRADADDQPRYDSLPSGGRRRGGGY